MDDNSVRANLVGGLVDYWPLTEKSGARRSLTGRNNMTDNNTVTDNSGLYGMVAQMSASNTEYLSRADNDDLDTGNIDFTWTAWVYLDTLGANRTIISKHGAVNNGEYMLRINTSNRVEFSIYDGTSVQTLENTLVTIVAERWYFISAWIDRNGNTVNILIDNGNLVSVAKTITIVASTIIFTIGTPGNVANVWNGRMGAIGFWKRILSMQDISYIYNNGLGRPLFIV